MKRNVEVSRKMKECKKIFSKINLLRKNEEVETLVWIFNISSMLMVLWTKRTLNTDVFQNTCFKERKKMVVAKNFCDKFV